MNRRFAQLAFLVPALALFAAAAWMMLKGRHPTGEGLVGTISEGGASLKSTSITLPTDEPVLPGGAASDIVANNCTACHSSEMILMQPPLDAKTWGSEIAKMRTAYKAPLDAKDDAAIVKALLTLPSQQRTEKALSVARPARR